MRESDLLTTDRIGQHEVLLPINHNRYNFRKKNRKHLAQASPVETMSKVKKFLHFGNSPVFFSR